MASPEQTLVERFPALGRIGLSAEERVPFVQQLSSNECGLACMCMVLNYYGKAVTLEDMRSLVSVDTNGITAQAVMEVGTFFGLRVRGVTADLDALGEIPRASILHWKFNHFVVFESADEEAVHIVDPAAGRIRVPMAKFNLHFTGVALLSEPGDDFVEQPAKASRVFRYLRTVLGTENLWSRIAVTSLILQLFALAVPLAMGAIVDRIIPRGDSDLLFVMGAGLVSVVGFNFLATWIRSHLFLHLKSNLDVRLTMGFFEHLVELPLPFFQSRPSGDLMSRMGDKQAVIDGLTAFTLSALLDGTLVILYLVLLMLMSTAMGVAVLILAALQVIVFWRSATQLKELNDQSLEINGRAAAGVTELILGMETLKSMGTERSMLRNWSNLFAASVNSQLQRGTLEARVAAFLDTLRMGSPLVVLLLGAHEVLHGGMSLGGMLALNALAMGFLGPLGGLVQTALTLRGLASHAERLDDIHNTPREKDRGKVNAAGRLKGGISLEHVAFRYSAIAPLTLKGVSLEITPGQFVAIVGPSGSGKTTLAGLLLGFYVPTEGRVLYDGVDLTSLDLSTMRRQLGVVTQRPFLFQASVRNNLAMMDPTITRETVEAAARRAQIHEDILQMPLGYDSLLSEGGNSLSGGQRQRLALARALVREPAILLLDEATSALDSITERAVQRELGRVACTKIVIAHRLSTVISADIILVLDRGRIAESGTHTELLQKHGLYATLISAQLQSD